MQAGHTLERISSFTIPKLVIVGINVHIDMLLASAMQVKGWLCCKVDQLQQGLQSSPLGQAFQDMDKVQLAAYCIAMMAEYVQERWLTCLRDIYEVPGAGISSAVIVPK